MCLQLVGFQVQLAFNVIKIFVHCIINLLKTLVTDNINLSYAGDSCIPWFTCVEKSQACLCPAKLCRHKMGKGRFAELVVSKGMGFSQIF